MTTNTFSTTKAFRLTGIAAFSLATLTVLSAVLAYLPTHPDFSIFNTYLSDIGDTPGWPQILFNSGTLLAAPLRLAAIFLLVLILGSFEKTSKGFQTAVLSIAAISTTGTIFMTAVPYSTGPTVHKIGILMYFLGVVFLQSMIGIKELKIQELPRSLAAWSFIIVSCFLVFFVMMILNQTGIVGRNAPVFWEWMCFASSLGWLVVHSRVLGNQ